MSKQPPYSALDLLKISAVNRHHFEVDKVLEMFSTLSQSIQSIPGIKGSAVEKNIYGALANIRSILEVRYDFFEYFNGCGPLARKIQEHLLIEGYLAKEDPVQLKAKVEEKLKDFYYRPHRRGDGEEVVETEKIIEENLRGLIFADDAPNPKTKITIPVTFDTPTGFYKLRSQTGSGYVRALVINIEHDVALASPDAPLPRLFLFASEEHPPELYFWHPQENHWLRNHLEAVLPDTAEVVLCGFEDVLKKIDSEQFGEESDIAVQDLEDDFKDLEHEVQNVFMQQSMLPPNYHSYRRQEKASQITVRYGDYGICFYCTEGKYEQRSQSVHQFVGAIPQSIKLSDIPVDELRGLYLEAKDKLKHLQSFIDRIHDIHQRSRH